MAYNCYKNYSLSAVRAVLLFCVIMALIVISGVKICLIMLDNSEPVVEAKTSKTLVLGESRGLILDRNLNRLVSESYYYAYAVKPSVSALNGLKQFLGAEQYVEASEQLGNNNPILITAEKPIIHKDIFCEQIYRRYNHKQTASHLIGYINSDYNGVSAIEKAYDEFLKSHSGTLSVRFFADGSGKIMQGANAVKLDNNYNSKAGVVLTIDKFMQSTLEDLIDNSVINKGAAVLVDAETGAIRASVSRPDFDPTDVSKYLNVSDLPLFNRVLGAYPVGSVFKPIVAAAALEQGVSPTTTYDCVGKISRSGAAFNCIKAHGKVNMSTALAFSCNCYFINLIEKIDIGALLETAKTFGFGTEFELAEGLLSYSGNLANEDELDSFSSRANLSFGQGSLTATPLQIASLYSAITNNGMYRKPYLVEGICDENGKFLKTHSYFASYRVFSAETAQKISDYLELVVLEGTGKNAASQYCVVGGKTATAQTGDFVDGKERLVTWFAGFFTHMERKYVLVIMSEDGTSGASDCAPIFSGFVNLINFVDN